MDDKIPFLRYRRKRFGSASGKTSDITEKSNVDTKTPLKKKRGADVEIALACLSSPERNASRLRPRKELPSFREIDVCDNDNRRIVGKRVKVYWPDSRRWFIGHVKDFHRRKQLHTIVYEDGDKEELDLRKERVEVEILSTENFHLRTEANYGKKLIKAVDAESTKILKVENETTETFGTRVAELVSGYDTESENVLKDLSKEAEDGEPRKKGDLDQDVDHNVEGCRKVDDQAKSGRKTESPAGERIENQGISNETQLADLDADAKEEDSFYDIKVNGKSRENLSKEKELVVKEIGEVRKAERQKTPIRRRRTPVITNGQALEHGESLKKWSMSKKNMSFRDTKIRSSKSPFKEASKETKRRDLDQDDSSLGKAIENRGISYESQLSNLVADVTQDKDGFYDVKVQRKPRNGEFGENLSKEKELASKNAGTVRKAENNAEIQRTPIRRRRTPVITK